MTLISLPALWDEEITVMAAMELQWVRTVSPLFPNPSASDLSYLFHSFVGVIYELVGIGGHGCPRLLDAPGLVAYDHHHGVVEGHGSGPGIQKYLGPPLFASALNSSRVLESIWRAKPFRAEAAALAILPAPLISMVFIFCAVSSSPFIEIHGAIEDISLTFLQSFLPEMQP